ncbi:HD domain-containing protein [Solimonas fluminis]|nr:HD domain-containing protein [Solimonas fluminis]
MDALLRAQMPDTRIVAEAGALVRAAFDDRLFHHTLRTHFLARRYAERFGIRCDPEQLAMACLFHDLGLVAPQYRADRAFTFSSSGAMKPFLLARGWTAARIVPAMEAIDFHMQLLPRWELGETAGLLQVGAWMDVTGLRSRRLPGAVREARAQFRRGSFFWQFNACLAGQLVSPRRALGLLAPRGREPAGHYGCEAHRPCLAA